MYFQDFHECAFLYLRVNGISILIPFPSKKFGISRCPDLPALKQTCIWPELFFRIISDTSCFAESSGSKKKIRYMNQKLHIFRNTLL